jgi:hypothetical protein
VAVYCDRCDLLVGLDGFHVLDVAERVGKRAASPAASPTATTTDHACCSSAAG